MGVMDLTGGSLRAEREERLTGRAPRQRERGGERGVGLVPPGGLAGWAGFGPVSKFPLFFVSFLFLFLFFCFLFEFDSF